MAVRPAPTLSQAFLEYTRAGKGKEPAYKPLTGPELTTFNRDFNYLVDKLRNIDEEIAREFEAKRNFYIEAAGIFKNEIDMSFGGIEPSSGQFGMALIPSRPFLGQNTWEVSITSAGWSNFWGSSASPISGSTTSGSQRGYYYQGVLYLEPGPLFTHLHFTINDYTYPVMSYEELTHIPKPDTTIRYIPFDKAILINTTGSHYVRALFLTTGTVNAKPLGLMFAEYDYLKTESNYYA